MGNRAVITTPDKKMGVYLHWNGGRDNDIDDSQPEGMRLGRYIDAVEVPVSEVEEGEEVWLESLRGGFEPYRVCGFAEPPSLRGTGKRLPFVERCNAGEGREAVLRNPNNFIRSATVRVTR